MGKELATTVPDTWHILSPPGARGTRPGLLPFPRPPPTYAHTFLNGSTGQMTGQRKMPHPPLPGFL